jgi:adenine-specific DNA methylase
MIQPKKLIEVAMPIKEISAESVRDKSIRHGHISTLHLWWARRPLPVCRAVVFASLVPDPLDEHCPQAFKDAVQLLLGKENNTGDLYKPYDDIPYTAAIDKMEDNLRNRLLMFIGKYSDEFARNEKAGKTTASGKQLSDASLIKWDNKNNEEIIGKARKLIWAAHNAASGASAKELVADFEKHYNAIKQVEENLYNTQDRHIENADIKKKETALHNAIESFLDKMPKVFDPFAGGGAIPLEAARLGCRSYGNDINPVAHIIQKGSLEFPQKFGKPITYSKEEFIKLYGEEIWNKQPQENKKVKNGEAVAVRIENRLSFDVEFYAKKLLAATEKEIGHLYPADKKGNKPIAYYWAREATCSNPSCKARVPLLKQFFLANTKAKQVYLKPLIKGRQIDFEIKTGQTDDEGWNNRGNLKCPCCGSITDVKSIKQQSISNTWGQRLLAVIQDGKNGKEYRLPTKEEIDILGEVNESERPTEKMQRNSAGGDTFSWGVTEWGQMFSTRQLYAIQALVIQLNNIKASLNVPKDEFSKSIITYLGILLDRITVSNTTFGRWHNGRETLEHPFSKQAISMIFDFPESNMFCDSTGSAANQLEWLIRYIESECDYPFSVELKNASSGDKSQFSDKYLTAVVTDPPYYDAIAYADLSDFFYVWLKRTLGDVYPLNFATPQTPKAEECTALKHHRNDSKEEAKKHFETKLTQIFDAIEHQTSDLVSIMFAHQSTEAWTTLCNAVLDARMNITGSWPVDTEMANRSLGLAGAALESSVTVACRPSQRQGYSEYREVKKAIEKTVAKEVNELYRLGFRGADLLTACFGQAVSEFGKYEKVEKADGSEVTVAELLEMARESAFNALLKGFDGDEYTKFYIGWLQLYGFAESDFDDAARFTRVGLSIEVQDLFKEHILIKNGNKQTLGGFEERIKADKGIGEKPNDYLIDYVHRAMALYKGANRTALLHYIGKVASSPESSFWRVVTSLCEVLPSGSEDHKQAIGLLTNKESLIRESKSAAAQVTEQTKLFE